MTTKLEGPAQEPCEICGRTTCEGTHMSTTSAVVPPTWATPPASPTVTLDRETYNRAIATAELIAANGNGWSRDRAREALALLRAAERHQP